MWGRGAPADGQLGKGGEDWETGQGQRQKEEKTRHARSTQILHSGEHSCTFSCI